MAVRKNTQKALEEVEQVLRDAGIHMYVNGCGCCGSPWVTFEYGGALLLDRKEDFILDSFPRPLNRARVG